MTECCVVNWSLIGRASVRHRKRRVNSMVKLRRYKHALKYYVFQWRSKVMIPGSHPCYSLFQDTAQVCWVQLWISYHLSGESVLCGLGTEAQASWVWRSHTSNANRVLSSVRHGELGEDCLQPKRGFICNEQGKIVTYHASHFSYLV